MGRVLREQASEGERRRDRDPAVTKPIPGAKRGRPRKPKLEKPKRSKGHPHIPLSEHPQRYRMAMQEAVANTFGSGWWAATALISAATQSSPLPDEDFIKSADRLRKQARPYRKQAADLAWLHAASDAIITMIGVQDRPDLADAAKRKVLRLAASINEMAWAERELLPMIEENREYGLARIQARALSD